LEGAVAVAVRAEHTLMPIDLNAASIDMAVIGSGSWLEASAGCVNKQPTSDYEDLLVHFVN
jgi:hypothetical protein